MNEKTLVFGDLHLGTNNREDRTNYLPWLLDKINGVKPDRIVFNGDIFELILPLDHKKDIRTKNHADILEDIIEAWSDFFYFLQNSSTKEFLFMIGEHDYELIRPELVGLLEKTLGKDRTRVGDHYYDKTSKTLIFHGHQLDYNSIFEVEGKKVSCIDGLTVAINSYLAQTPDIERGLKRAQEVGAWSFWYPYGGLPKFIEDTSRLFGNDFEKYGSEVSLFLKGLELERWLRQQKNVVVRAVGKASQLLANGPSLLMSFYGPFYNLMGKVVDSRVRKILTGGQYPDMPDFCRKYDIENLVLSHSHNPREFSYKGKRFLDIASPRIHPRIIGNYVRAWRAFDCLLIDRKELVRDVKEETKWIPLSFFLTLQE